MNLEELIRITRDSSDTRAVLRWIHEELKDLPPVRQELWWQRLREEGAWDLEDTP